MPVLIAIHGPMAAGKSTLTALVREALPSFSYIDRPMIKRGLKPAGKEFALKISKQACFLIVKELAVLNKDIIVQELNPTSIKKRVLEIKGYKFVSFILQCEVEKAVKRNQIRSKHIPDERVRKVHREYRDPDPEDIVLNTEENSPEECLKLILEHVKAH